MIQSFAAKSNVTDGQAGQPRRVDRSIPIGGFFENPRRIGRQFDAFNGACPEVERRRRCRQAGGSGAHTHQQRRQVVRLAHERLRLQGAPVAGRGDRGGSQRAHSVETRRRIVHPQAEREPLPVEIELADRVVEARHPAFVLCKQGDEKSIRAREAGPNDVFPQPASFVNARRHDTTALHANLFRKHRERLDAERIYLRENRRMVRQILQRLIVQGGEPVTEERGLPIGENLDHEIARRDGAQEYGLAPNCSGQRHRNELARSRGGRGALT